MTAFSFGRLGAAARPPSGSIAGRYAWAKNESSPGADDGTRIDASLANEIVGNLRSLLAAAGETSSDPGDSEKLRRAVDALVYSAIALRAAWSRGNWEVGDTYSTGEAVVFEGEVYICIVDHTANGDLPPGATPEVGENPFQIMRWRGDWAGGTAYEVGDAFIHLATFYITRAAHVSDASLPPGHTPEIGENPAVLFGGGYLNESEFTPGAILDMLLGVDGAGSGLDADMLDGQHASAFAPRASPAFTGTPTAPTPSGADVSTRIATTAFVHDKVEEAVLDAGAGDITGPSSSTDGHAVVFNGATGKVIKSANAAPRLVGQVTPIADGGTGAANAAGARSNLGAQAAHALLSALSGLTPTNGHLIGGNGTTFQMLDNAAVRAALGLGALALLSTINNSHWSGTDLAIENGGTGASTAEGARSNLGVAAASHGHAQSDISGLVAALAAKAPQSHTHDAGAIATGLLPVARGGTGAGNAATALANLGAAPASHDHDISEVEGLQAALDGKVTSVIVTFTGGGGASSAITNINASIVGGVLTLLCTRPSGGGGGGD